MKLQDTPEKDKLFLVLTEFSNFDVIYVPNYD